MNSKKTVKEKLVSNKGFQVSKRYLYLVGIVLFVVVLSQINLGKVWTLLTSITLRYLLFALIIFLPMLALKAGKWKYLLGLQGIKPSFMGAFLMYSASMFVGYATPGRLGDFSKVLYLKKENYSLGKSLFSVFVDRLSDLAILFVVALTGVAFFFDIERFLMLSAIILIIITILIFYKQGVLQVARFMFNRFIPIKYKSEVKINFYDFLNDFTLLKKKQVTYTTLLTLIIWLGYFLQSYFLALSLSIPISFTLLSFCIAMTSVFALLPISFFNVGVRDITLIGLFTLMGLSTESAVSLSLLMLFHMLYSTLLGLIAWFIKPLRV
jgi:glycosyltransferase 2 family protein